MIDIGLDDILDGSNIWQIAVKINFNLLKVEISLYFVACLVSLTDRVLALIRAILFSEKGQATGMESAAALSFELDFGGVKTCYTIFFT